MESATIAANGFRFRVPYGTLLCVSDKPLHGEIKLPGMANHFYRERVDQHLRIGMRAIELLRAGGRRPAAQPQAAQLRRGRVPVGRAGVQAFVQAPSALDKPPFIIDRHADRSRATSRRSASTTRWRCSTSSSAPPSSIRMPPRCAGSTAASPSGCRSSPATGARSRAARGRSASAWRASSSSCCHKPRGWMDQPHGRTARPQTPTAPATRLTRRRAADDDERFIVGLVLTYYRRHPRARPHPPARPARRGAAAPAAAPAAPATGHAPRATTRQLWSKAAAAVAPLKRKR